MPRSAIALAEQEFWNWLAYQASQTVIKVPREIADEVASGTDELAKWLKRGRVGHSLILGEEVDVRLQRDVLARYADDLTDEEVVSIGRDPFLIAYALVDPLGRCVVTTEHSRPRALRHNRQIPDVCKDLGIRCCNTYALIRELGFSTSWDK